MEKGLPIRSVGRCLAVLQAVNQAGSLSLIEIARIVGLPYATVTRLVMTLTHAGMIEKELGRKNYRPTVLVQSLASGYRDHSQLGDVARPHIVELTSKHGCPVAVSTRFGMDMIVRECTHSLSPYTLSKYYPGFVYPLVQSAAGLVQLAFSSVRERELSRAALLETDGMAQKFAFPSDAVLDDIQRTGFATRGRNKFTLPNGKNSGIAAPIFHNGQLCGTVALIFLASSIRMDKAVEAYAQDVIDTADAIGRDMDNQDLVPARLSA
jgi:IclR family mhp operon transcriptional activator